ncbi:MAG TPA: hypothetical protein VLK23_10070 [Thermodesulfobacteriota bacterium]|nr:hypothetical protein [Thermodesulfobacteriota bacterium]
MGKKKLGSALTWIGIVILLISVSADFLGIGGYPGLGTKQIIGTIAGIIIIGIGYLLSRK